MDIAKWIMIGCLIAILAPLFGVSVAFLMGRIILGKDKNKDDELRLLESICVQHEIDHLNGATILDREDKSEPIVVKTKIGRNDPCYCGSEKKYKKCCINK